MKKFLIDPEEQEHQLINFIWALFCCNIFIGSMLLLEIVS